MLHRLEYDHCKQVCPLVHRGRTACGRDGGNAIGGIVSTTFSCRKDKHEMLRNSFKFCVMTQVEFDDIMRKFCSNDETLEELKAAAFEVLRLNPGCEQSDWAKILIEQYGTEVVDAYGKDPAEAYASLEDLWESPYLDEVSGLEYDFKTWAEAFATDAAVQMYYDLTDKNE